MEKHEYLFFLFFYATIAICATVIIACLLPSPWLLAAAERLAPYFSAMLRLRLVISP